MRSIINRVHTQAESTLESMRHDYEIVTDSDGKVKRDKNGKPHRDARDLPPVTEFARHGVTGKVDRPNTTYEVTHIDVDTDWEFDRTFGQLTSIWRKKYHTNKKKWAFQDVGPRYLTDIERVARLEFYMKRIEDEDGIDVTIERVNPIAFRVTDIEDDFSRRGILDWVGISLGVSLGETDRYGFVESGDDMLVWCRIVPSYPFWGQFDKQFAPDE